MDRRAIDRLAILENPTESPRTAFHRKGANPVLPVGDLLLKGRKRTRLSRCRWNNPDVASELTHAEEGTQGPMSRIQGVT